jgi:virginiamycin B lyase
MSWYVQFQKHCRFIIPIAGILLTLNGPALHAASLSGVVKDIAGQPVSGALIKVSGTDTGLSYLVVSEGQGQYTTPPLLPGHYTVQAFGGGYQSDTTGQVEIIEDIQNEINLELNTDRLIVVRPKKMTNADYVSLMPEGAGKGLVASTCSLCHNLDRVVPARKTQAAWEITVKRMTYFLEDRVDLGGPLSEQQEASILDYLATHFTRESPRMPEYRPSDPNQHLPSELLEGRSARFVAMEFDPGTNADRLEIGIDAEGHPWLSERGYANFGWFDLDTLNYNRLEIPPGSHPRDLAQIAVDPQGLVWILDNGSRPDAELISYDPHTEKFNFYPVPLQSDVPRGFAAPLNTLRFLEGNVWGTGNVSSRVVKLDPRSGEVTAYPSPRGSHPYGIAIADQAVWYITNYKNEIVRLDPDTGEQTPFLPPTPRSGLRRMGTDAMGSLWVGGQDSNKLVKLETRTGKVTEYTVPTAESGPYSVDVDTHNSLIWFSERDADKLGRFDPRTGDFIEFPLVTAGIEARRIFVDPVNPKRVWWGCASDIDRFGYIEVLD